MTKNILRWMISSLLIAGGMANASMTGNAIKVGVLVHESKARDGKDLQAALFSANAALEARKFSKINSTVILTADYKGRDEEARKVIKKWSSDDVDVIIGGNSPRGLSGLISETVKQKKMILLTGEIGADVIDSCSPLTMQVAESYNLKAAAMVKDLFEKSNRNFYIIGTKNKDGDLMRKSLIKSIRALGGNISGERYVIYPEITYKEELMDAQQSGASVVLLAMDDHEAEKLMKDLEEINEKNNGLKLKLAPLSFNQRMVKRAIEKQDTNVIFTSGTEWSSLFNGKEAEYIKRFMATFKRLPLSDDIAIYVAMSNYINAVESLETDDPDKVYSYLMSGKESSKWGSSLKFSFNGEGKLKTGIETKTLKTGSKIEDGSDLEWISKRWDYKDLNALIEEKDCGLGIKE